jgi:hypothetical protein
LRSIDQFNFFGLQNFDKKAILIIYPNSQVLKKKIVKVLDTFCENYFLGEDLELSFADQYKRATEYYETVFNVVEMGKKEKKKFLDRLKESSSIEAWRVFFWKERALYTCMNKLIMQN